MKRRRGFGKRIAAGLMAVLMTVGMMPVDLSGILAKSSVVALAETTLTKEFRVQSGTYDKTNTLTSGSSNGRSGTITAVYDYDTDNDGKSIVRTVKEGETASEENFDFVAYLSDKAGINSLSSTKTYFGSEYTYRFNTQGTMAVNKYTVGFKIDSTSTIEIIWQSGVSSTSEDEARWAAMKKVNADGSAYTSDVFTGTIVDTDSTSVTWNTANVSDKSKVYKTTYTGVESGTYQVGSIKSTIYIYGIRVYSESSDETVNTVETYGLSELAAGSSVSYDFKGTNTVFGAESVTADTYLVENEKNYVQLVAGDGNTLTTTNNTHGLNRSSGSSNFSFRVLVPANTTGTFSVVGCQHNQCTARMKVGDTTYDAVEIKNGGNDSAADTPTVFEYKNETDSVVVMEVEIVKSGNTFVHGINYAVTSNSASSEPSDENGLKTLSVGGSDGYDFRSNNNIFGKDSITSDTLSTDGYIKLDIGSNSSLTTGDSHGIKTSNDIAFEVIVPANTVGTFSLKGCLYGNNKASVTIDGNSVGSFGDGVSVKVSGTGVDEESDYSEAVSIQGTDTSSDNSAATVFACTNTSSQPVTMKVQVEKYNGTIYVHKVDYAVSDIPAETCDVNVTLDNDILSNATDGTLTYTFTNGTATKTFTASQMKSGKIQLEAGTYTLSLSGDAIEKPSSDYKAYELADASKTVTVSSSGTNSLTVSLTQVTKWLFGNTTGFKGLYQYNKVETGYYKGISISASVNGAKLNTLNTDGSENASRNTNAQFNEGTILSVPVAGACKIKVTMSSTYAYTIDGMAVNKAEFTYVYPGNAGMVNIVSTASDYIVSIEILDETVDTVSASGTVSLSNGQTLPENLKLIFTNTADAGQVYYASVASDGSYALNLPSTSDGVTFKATLNTTAYAISTGSSMTAKTGTNIEQNITIRENIARNITLNIKGDETPNLNADGVEIVFTNVDDKTDVTRATYGSDIQLYDGTYRVTIDGENYHTQGFKLTNESLNLEVSADTSFTLRFEKAASWKFNAKTGDTDDYYALTIQGGSTLYYYNGLKLDATKGKLYARLSSGDTQANSGTVIYVPVTGAGTVTVEASSGKGYGQYVTIGEGNTAVTGTADVDSVSYKYTGTTESMIPVTISGNIYLQSISVTYAGNDTAGTEQTIMPSVDDGKLVASVKDNISVNAAGQKLNITQTGGDFSTPSNVSYYVFPATKDVNVLEFDAVVTAATNKSACGFFGGIFTEKCQYTIAMRSASTSLRALKSSSTTAYSSASGTDYGITLGTKVHYSITVDGTKASITATFVDKNGVSQTNAYTQTMVESDVDYYYGFAVANATATVTNMVYKSSDGTVYYSQNNAYEPKGKAPVATGVTAVTRTGTTKSDTINVSWEGEEPENDGYYELQVQIDGGAWTTVATDIVEMSYAYHVGAATTHSYAFRVYGVLGKGDNGGTKSDAVSVTMKDRITGALATPVVTATAGTSSITLTWDKDSNATEYWVYRYSYDEGAANAKKVATAKSNTYTDTTAKAEMPYYYYVSSKSDSNSSDFSETVWAMITTTAAHTGTYVYEDDATEIFITEKSYDTVFSGNATLKGNVYGVGTLTVSGGSGAAQSKTISASGDSFEFTIPLNQGRNDVNLVFTDSKGNKTRKTYNFVYLTNYNILVDSSYKGTDGAANTDGVPTYKTVQAAVNSVSADNAERVVILVAAGSYNERLVVDKPYVTIIGQDRENTLVHYAPGSVGGDMGSRCAIYIQEKATGFSAENISFANDYVYGSLNQSNESADALRVDATESSFVNVKISGVQDTLYMDKGNQYYYKCRIEGLIDYIYSGEKARAFFEDCELVFLYNSNKTSGYVCAPKTSEDATYGLTFYNCVVTAEEGCNGTGYLLARPWGANAYITWINCYMGKAVNATLPYSDMSGNAYAEARFYEYGTYGPGFAVNSDRRQISATQATAMVSTSYLGWSPSGAVSTIGGKYVGSIAVKALSDNVETEVRVVNTYEQTDGDDSGLARYSQEGFASVYSSNGVTGGGLQKVDTADYDNPNYYEVKTATEFLDALLSVKKSGKASVINLTADVNLGSNEIANYSSYSDVIKAYTAQASMHPTLKQTGVSVLTISNMYNLTIMSSNGSAIKHANITMKNSSNIIIRNIVFDELWEWDEATAGDYDVNDWDYMTLDTGTNGVWIDHCTFYKAYDGVVDIKNPNPTDNVTISWCAFLPASAGYVYGVDSEANDSTFFGIMMKELKDNADKYPYYQSLLDAGMTHQQIIGYAYGQKKTHLLGQSAEATNAVGIKATFANNYYKDSMDRMPRLRYGTAHVYNCVLDAQDLFTIKASITNKEVAKHIVSNGVSSTCNGQILVENSYINGIVNALNSGNGSDASGYIDAVNSLYYINGVRYALEPKVNTTKAGEVVKKTNASAFRTALGYSYNLRDAASLSSTVVPYTGAGKLNLTVLQWEKNTYNDTYVSEGSTGTYTNDGLPSSPYSESTSSSSSGNGGSGNDGSVDNAGNGGNVGDGNVSDDDYGYDDDNSSTDDSITSGGAANVGSSSGATGTDSTVSEGTTETGTDNADTTPVGEVLTPEDVPGATVTTIDGTEFTEMGTVGASTGDVMEALDANGNITTNEPVIQTTEDLVQTIAEQIAAGADEFYVFASENAEVAAEVIDTLVDAKATMSIGIVGNDGKCSAVLTLDGNVLEKSGTNFNLKVTVDAQSQSVANMASSHGITQDRYTVVDFEYSGELPGVFKVAVDVSAKYADGTRLALYYNNTAAGRLENQYQVTNVRGGFAEFAISHCSEYVLVDVSAAQSVITTNTLSSPKTGDGNHLLVWVTMMGIVVAAYFGYSSYARDKKKVR
jgi:pectin methylesterase-like acyl-CoA thioesterase/pectate lyase